MPDFLPPELAIPSLIFGSNVDEQVPGEAGQLDDAPGPELLASASGRPRVTRRGTARSPSRRRRGSRGSRGTTADRPGNSRNPARRRRTRRHRATPDPRGTGRRRSCTGSAPRSPRRRRAGSSVAPTGTPRRRRFARRRGRDRPREDRPLPRGTARGRHTRGRARTAPRRCTASPTPRTGVERSAGWPAPDCSACQGAPRSPSSTRRASR